jgi:hypothetical protein
LLKGSAHGFVAKHSDDKSHIRPKAECHDTAKEIIGVDQGFSGGLPPSDAPCDDLELLRRLLKGKGRALAVYGRCHEHKSITEHQGGKLHQPF